MAEQDVLLRLVLKGMDPAEAARLAGQSLAAVTAEVNAALAKQAEAHRKASEAQTAEARKAAKEEVKDAQEKTRGVVAAMRAIEAEAKKAAGMTSTHWRRMLEDMENITVVSAGVASAVTSMGTRLASVSEEIIKVTNVFGSLKGSVEEASKATQGTVTNMDLIIAKNRAMALDLELTDQQFADIAQAADNYADSLGTNTNDALEKIIQSLGTGTEKGLKQAGIIRDLDKVYQEFAKSIGTTADKLSDQGKRVAMQQAALAELRKRAVEAAADMGKPVNVATALEQAIVGVKNQWHAFVNMVGSFSAPEWLQEFLQGPTYRMNKFVNQIAAGRASVDAVAAKYGPKAALGAPAGMNTADLIDQGKAKKPKDYSMSQDARGMLRAADEQIRAQDRIDDEVIKQQQEAQRDIERFYEELTGDSASLINEKIKKGEKAQADYEKRFADMRQHAMEAGQELRDKLGNTNEKAGGGVFARLLFGADGPDVIYEQMDAVGKASVDAMGMLSGSAEAMAQGFGQAFASAAEGSKGFAEALKDSSRAAIKSLAAEAATRALMETGMGLAALALGGPIAGASAAEHFSAAAVFGGIALTSGAALRAIGPSASHGSSPTTQRTPTFSSSGSSAGRTSSNGDVAPTIINVSVFPGGEQAAGDAVVKALEARKAQTGRGIDHLMS